MKFFKRYFYGKSMLMGERHQGLRGLDDLGDAMCFLRVLVLFLLFGFVNLANARDWILTSINEQAQIVTQSSKATPPLVRYTKEHASPVQSFRSTEHHIAFKIDENPKTHVGTLIILDPNWQTIPNLDPILNVFGNHFYVFDDYIIYYTLSQPEQLGSQGTLYVRKKFNAEDAADLAAVQGIVVMDPHPQWGTVFDVEMEGPFFQANSNDLLYYTAQGLITYPLQQTNPADQQGEDLHPIISLPQDYPHHQPSFQMNKKYLGYFNSHQMHLFAHSFEQSFNRTSAVEILSLRDVRSTFQLSSHYLAYLEDTALPHTSIQDGKEADFEFDFEILDLNTEVSEQSATSDRGTLRVINTTSINTTSSATLSSGDLLGSEHSTAQVSMNQVQLQEPMVYYIANFEKTTQTGTLKGYHLERKQEILSEDSVSGFHATTDGIAYWQIQDDPKNQRRTQITTILTTDDDYQNWTNRTELSPTPISKTHQFWASLTVLPKALIGSTVETQQTLPVHATLHTITGTPPMQHSNPLVQEKTTTTHSLNLSRPKIQSPGLWWLLGEIISELLGTHEAQLQDSSIGVVKL